MPKNAEYLAVREILQKLHATQILDFFQGPQEFIKGDQAVIRTRQAIALLLTFCLLLWPAGSLPQAMTVREEKELAEEFLKAVHDHYNVIDDFVIHQYINDLGSRILAGLPPQPFEYKFHVINQDTVNAFAGPAGNIFIFSGLFEAMETEGELAGIVAHEIAHVSARHISEIMEKSKKSQMLSMAGMIAGILVGLGGASAVGSALSIGSLAAGQSMILAYTRENELEADLLGRQYLLKADYDLYGLREALKKIRAREWFGEEEIPTYLKTHPATRERLSNLENILERHPERQTADSLQFRRTRARLIALYGNPAREAQRFRQQLANQPDDLSAQYGLALALAESGRPESALEAIKEAISQRPDDPVMTIDLGRIYFLAGQHSRAADTLLGIDNIAEYGQDGLFYLGRSQMSLGDIKAAISTFKQVNENFPDHQRSLYFLGSCYGELGELDKAHYFLGRYYRQAGENENARFHFNQALEKSSTRDMKEKILTEMEKAKKQPPKKTEDETGPSKSPLFSGQVITYGQNERISW